MPNIASYHFNPPPVLTKIALRTLTLVLLALFCLLLAKWTWYFLQPRAAHPLAPVAHPANTNMLNNILSANLFGAGNEASPSVNASRLDIRLLGVFAAQGRLPAYAIVNVDGVKNEAVAVGAEIKPGVRLEEVHARHVILRHNGVSERLAFPEVTANTVPAGQPSFNLNVTKQGADRYSFSRSQLNTALQDPKHLANLGLAVPYPGGGMELQSVPGGSLAAQLGMQSGDIVLKINGVSVASQGDLAALYQKLAEVKEIKVEGLRNGKPLNLNYVVQQ